MPTPIGLISAADSNIRQGIPAACSASPRVNPPTPAPTIMISSNVTSRRALSGDWPDETRLVSLLSIWGSGPVKFFADALIGSFNGGATRHRRESSRRFSLAHTPLRLSRNGCIGLRRRCELKLHGQRIAETSLNG